MMSHPLGRPLARRHRQQTRQHPHPQHHWLHSACFHAGISVLCPGFAPDPRAVERFLLGQAKLKAEGNAAKDLVEASSLPDIFDSAGHEWVVKLMRPYPVI